MKWQKVRLDSVCESISDGDHLAPPKSDSGVPFITISNIDSNNNIDFTRCMYVPRSYYENVDSKRKPQRGDVLYSVVGSFGKPVLMRENAEFVFQRHIAILRPKSDVLSSRFLYATMLSPAFYALADAAAVGTAQRTVSLSSLRGMEISLPPLPIQQKIADILGAYDDLIENNRRRIELLEKMARELYRERFVRREPKSSPCKLGELIEVCYGKDHKKLLAGEVPVYGSGGIMRNVDRALYSGEAILIPRKGTLNNVMYVNGDFWTVDTMFYAKPKNWYVAPYVYQLLSSMNLMTFNSGTAVPSMTTEILNSMPVLLPEEEHLRAYAGMFGVMFSERILLESQNRNLVKQRDRLLPRLMSGKIELDKLVKEAE